MAKRTQSLPNPPLNGFDGKPPTPSSGTILVCQPWMPRWKESKKLPTAEPLTSFPWESTRMPRKISSTRNDRIPGEPVRGVFRSAHLMTTGRYIKPAGQGTIPFCGHILAPMISSSWRRCMWIPFTLHGAPFRYSGLTKWMDAVPGTLKDPSGSTRRS